MSILLLELNPNIVSVDERLFPNRDKNLFIYDHLKYYCSKGQSVPAITIRVCANSAMVTRGHYYLSIAKELEHKKIQVVVDQALSKDIPVFLSSPSIIQVDWDDLRQAEDRKLIEYIWYIFFFQEKLDQLEQDAFHKLVINFYRQIQLPVEADKPESRILNLNYSHLGHSVEFQAYVPFADERWYGGSLAALIDFHTNYVPVISFQGRKFYLPN